MRTKTLLIAAAALAVGVATSMAQTTYSQNIVGYANIVLVGGQNLICNPFDDGNGNHLTNLIAATLLPAKSTVTTWNFAGQAPNGAITDVGGTAWASDTTLPPGAGFFVKNGTVASPPVTNTFVGNVVVNVGSTTTNVLGLLYNLVGSQVPYGAADLFTDVNFNLVNAGLAGKSYVQYWNAGAQGYSGQLTFATAPATPVAVGQGFFIHNVTAAGLNWIQTVNP